MILFELRAGGTSHEMNDAWLSDCWALVLDTGAFLHCTDPGLEQERNNVTFRWSGNMLSLADRSIVLFACA